jgi:hypothetical protein
MSRNTLGDNMLVSAGLRRRWMLLHLSNSGETEGGDSSVNDRLRLQMEIIIYGIVV